MTIPSEGVSHFNIGWLAGIFDGEGTVRLYISKNHDRRRGKHIIRDNTVYRLQIVNTDIAILTKVLDILTRLDILAYVYQKSASKKAREGSFKFSKPCFDIIISQRRSIEKLTRLIYPHLAGDKKDKCLKLMKYFNIHPFNAGRKTPRVETERLTPESNLLRFEQIRMKLQSVL